MHPPEVDTIRVAVYVPAGYKTKTVCVEALAGFPPGKFQFQFEMGSLAFEVVLASLNKTGPQAGEKLNPATGVPAETIL